MQENAQSNAKMYDEEINRLKGHNKELSDYVSKYMDQIITLQKEIQELCKKYDN